MKIAELRQSLTLKLRREVLHGQSWKGKLEPVRLDAPGIKAGQKGAGADGKQGFE
jgi:hypothetical protein